MTSWSHFGGVIRVTVGVISGVIFGVIFGVVGVSFDTQCRMESLLIWSLQQGHPCRECACHALAQAGRNNRARTMEGAEHGPKRKKLVGDGVPIDSWAQCMSQYVEECIGRGIAPFPIGSYVHIRSAHAACMQSVMSMLQLLKMMFSRAPEGIVNYTKLCSVLRSSMRQCGVTGHRGQWKNSTRITKGGH